ncbi:hypothetical protein TNCV_2068371 [Trichonephila clavipes]|uniref:Uncharacterized protein n=1 Tax=Trichonephila clavipes TaxID=2585209 RepID=A0A8X6W3J1_TRICX|nr:hypothetical protein TNCV_2068371 [Trichonephila clavipes]
MYCLKAQTNNRTNIEVTEVIAVKVLKHLSSHQKGMHIIGADPDSLDLPNYRGQPGFEKKIPVLLRCSAKQPCPIR